MPDSFIVNVCLTGMVASKKQNPHLPLSPEEIAANAEACVALGASILHVHARDDAGEPEWRKERYQEICRAIRRVSPDVVICASTSGRRVTEVKQRVDCLDTDPPPDMASLTLGSLNFLHEGVLNSPRTVRALAGEMAQRGVKPELEVFDLGMARMAARLLAEGALESPCYVNVLLGNIGTAAVGMLDLAAILGQLPGKAVRCIAGIASEQLRANMLGLLFADGVRVGLEDALYLDRRKEPATNSALVKRVVEIGRQLGRKPCSIAETRSRLGL